jgi:GT2 family glycosyltransferase
MNIDLPRSPAPRVSVIIVATASLDLLRECLRSVARFGPSAIPFETIVVLNEPGQDTAAALRATVTGVQVASSPVNLGIAGAGNRGRALARGEFLLLLHDDAEVDAGWMEALVQTADEHPEAGAVGGKVLHLDGRLQNAGMILWRDGYTSASWIGAAPPPTAFDRPRAVDYCGSSSLLVRAAAWDAAGGLDENLYPVYHVDVDLGMALRRLGFVVFYQPASRIRHHQGASGNPRFRAFAGERNRQAFIAKWGKALEEQEPRVTQSASAVERAMARAEAFAEECRRKGPPAIAPQTTREAFDPVVQERQHYERNRAFQKVYVAHLTQTLAEAERNLAQLRARLAEPDYRIGDTIDFSDSISSRRFLAGAWGETESWGAWTVGPHAGLTLRIDADPAEPLILNVLAQAFLTGMHPRVCVSVSAAGRQVAEWVFDLRTRRSSRLRWCQATIPARIGHDRNTPLEISFMVDAPVSPLVLGLSADERMLGLGLCKLSLDRRAKMPWTRLIRLCRRRRSL